jgi:hypothetical protein
MSLTLYLGILLFARNKILAKFWRESLSEGEPARATTANDAERHQTLKCKVKAYFNYNYDTIHY